MTPSEYITQGKPPEVKSDIDTASAKLEEEHHRRQWLEHPFTQKLIEQLKSKRDENLEIIMNGCLLDNEQNIKALAQGARAYNDTIILILNGE